MANTVAIPKLGNINYKIKRASAGLGLFALEDIKKETWLIEYVGKIVVGKKEVKDYPPNNQYLFEVNSAYMIDGRERSNIARYINHSCKPNCEASIIAKRVFIKTIKNIKAGEEFTYDYGKEFIDEHIKPYGCRCAPCKTDTKERNSEKIVK